ncbi:MAG: diguanylate cyclase domain-containing protein [Thiobacillaceae bacterium]
MPPERQAVSTAVNGRSPFNHGWRAGLLLGFVVLLLLILTVTGIGYLQFLAAQARLQDLTSQHMKKLELTKIMLQSALNRTLLLQRIMLHRDPFARDESRMAFEAHGAEFVQARQALRALGLSPQEQALLDEMRTTIQRTYHTHQEIIDLAYADRLDEADRLLIEQAIPAQDAFLTVLSRFDRLIREAAQQTVRQYEREYILARNSLLFLSAAAMAVGLLMAIWVYRKMSEASRMREHLATHDALTGLPNRLLLEDRIDQAIAHARRERRKLGVMFIDLDGFKRVNDSLGHAAGDALIRAVAGRIQAGIRAEDTVARVGGDEFVVVGGGAQSVDDLIHVAENLIATISRPYELGGQQIYIGCSIGISFYPDDGDAAQTLIEHADVAMYHAKEAGRGCYRLFDPVMIGRTIET